MCFRQVFRKFSVQDDCLRRAPNRSTRGCLLVPHQQTPHTMPVTMRGSPISPPRDEMGAARDLIAQRRRQQIEEENKVYKDHLKNAKPTIDDDTEDDATGEARARLRVEAAAAREAAEAERKAKARDFHAKIKAAHTVTDDWMDTEAAAVARDRMAAESRARKATEQAAIAEANRALADRELKHPQSNQAPP